jgi:hypothetical protein
MPMHPAVKGFVDIMTEDVNKWEKAAEDVKELMKHVPAPDRGHWAEVAEKYSQNADRYKSIIKQYLEDNEPGKKQV